MAGFAGCGEWFAVDRWRVTPDLITFAKGVNSGFVPLGGVLICEAIAATFDEWPFSGDSPTPVLACASAVTSITVMGDEKVVEHARALGEEVIGPELRALAERHPSVGAVRGLGVFWRSSWSATATTREPLVPAVQLRWRCRRTDGRVRRSLQAARTLALRPLQRGAPTSYLPASARPTRSGGESSSSTRPSPSPTASTRGAARRGWHDAHQCRR